MELSDLHFNKNLGFYVCGIKFPLITTSELTTIKKINDFKIVSISEKFKNLIETIDYNVIDMIKIKSVEWFGECIDKVDKMYKTNLSDTSLVVRDINDLIRDGYECKLNLSNIIFYPDSCFMVIDIVSCTVDNYMFEDSESELYEISDN